MPLSACQPGEWYLVVACVHCNTRGPLLRDLSQGRSEIFATYTWFCPICGQVNQYEPQDIERYKHPATASDEGEISHD